MACVLIAQAKLIRHRRRKIASKLLLFNASLTLCGERKLASLTENREPRRLLDDVWDGGAVKTCLEAGLWNHATRALKIEFDPSFTQEFGFARGFVKPSDWVRTAVTSANAYFRPPFKSHQFADEAGHWWADIDTLFVKMVSDGVDYGGDLGSWPESFSRYVEAYLASRIAFKITRSTTLIAGLEDKMVQLVKGATAKDAMNEGAAFAPEGSWNSARRGRGISRRDGGSRSQLIG